MEEDREVNRGRVWSIEAEFCGYGGPPSSAQWSLSTRVLSGYPFDSLYPLLLRPLCFHSAISSVWSITFLFAFMLSPTFADSSTAAVCREGWKGCRISISNNKLIIIVSRTTVKTEGNNQTRARRPNYWPIQSPSLSYMACWSQPIIFSRSRPHHEKP